MFLQGPTEPEAPDGSNTDLGETAPTQAKLLAKQLEEAKRSERSGFEISILHKSF